MALPDDPSNMPPGAHPDAEPDFRALFDSAPCGLLLTDRDGLVLSANRTFCDWMGIDRDALVGKRRFQDLLSIGGRIFHQTHWAPLLQMQGSIAEVKLDIVTASDRLVPMVLNAVRRQEHERVVHQLALFVAEDRHAYERELLRARRGAEALLVEQTRVQEALALSDVRLRMALDTANLHIWEVDARTLERHYAPSIALLLGYPEPRAIAADEYIGAVEPHDRERAMEAFARVLDRTTDVYRCTYRINGVDGRQRTVQASARALADPDGNIVRIVGLLQDISELEAQRVAAEDRALFAEQMIGIVSHDLRNPLSTIRMGTQVLEMIGVADNQRGMLGNIKRASARAQRLIDDLLDFTVARVGSGLTISPEPTPLHPVIGGLVEELSLANPGKRIVHQARGAGTVRADAHRLSQLVGNLVSNAIAYGDNDFPVTVTSHIEPARSVVSVHNHGAPIAQDLLPRLFQPMVRGSDEHSEMRSVGLGLFIVQEIARAHGGDVSVRSDAGEGTLFEVVLPRD